MSSPAFDTFLRELLHVARALESALHAPDDQIERDLHHRLAALSHALERIEPVEWVPAYRLLASLRERLEGRELECLEPLLRVLR